MSIAKILKEDLEISQRLNAFSVTRHEIIEDIIRPVVGARANCVDADVATAKGYTSYMYGTRQLRTLFYSKGWIKYETQKIEGIENPQTGTIIIFQNVYLASSTPNPKPISRKGKATEKLINDQQLCLFRDEDIPLLIDTSKEIQLNKKHWYLCVSFHNLADDTIDVRAELSCPQKIENGTFKGFHERIFLLKGDEFRQAVSNPIDDMADTAFEVEPEISRRK